MKFNILFMVLAFILLLFINSCEKNTIYYHFRSCQIEGWNEADEITFRVAFPSDIYTFSTEILLRANDIYPYQQIGLAINRRWLRCNENQNDTILLEIMDSLGHPKSKGVHLYLYSCILPDMKFYENDTLTIVINHIMQCKNLPGICDVGVHIMRQ